MALASGPRTGLAPDPFIGRAAALSVLREMLTHSPESIRAAYVEGEAGIGKSRLTQVFAEEAQQVGVLVVRGRCYEQLTDVPYFPWLEVLKQLRLHTLTAEIQEGGFTPRRRSREWASLSADARTQRAEFILRFSEAIVRKATTQSILIILEDVPWADVNSLLLINSLLDSSSGGLLLLCTARPEAPDDVARRSVLHGVRERSRLIDLEGLNHDETRELMTAISALPYADDDVRVLLSLSRGNPLFIRELLFHLRQTKLLARHTVEDALHRIRVPDKLSHLIDLRLADLSASVRRALSAAAVVGSDFDAATLSRVTNREVGTVAQILESACSRGILQPSDDLVRSRYTFAHPLFRKQLEQRLPPSIRRALHQKIADAADRGEIRLTVNERALHHAMGSRARQGNEAAEHCRAAAEQAETVYAYESAARSWELALACTGHGQDRARADLLSRYGWALWAAHMWERAEQVWAEAADLYETLGASEQLGLLALAIGGMLRWRQDLARSELWLERGLQHLPADSANRGRALALLGSIRCLQGDPDDALHLLNQALRLRAAHHVPDAQLAFWLSEGFRRVGKTTRSLAVARGALEEARGRDPTGTVLLAATLSHMELTRLRLAAAQRYAAIVEGATARVDAGSLTVALQCQAFLLGYLGEWPRVSELCEHWMARVRLAGRYQVANARFLWAEAQFAQGRLQDARTQMERALPDLESMRPVCGVHLARVLIQLGDRDEAGKLVSSYAALLGKSQVPKSGRAVVGEAASELDDPSLWKTCYELLATENAPLVLAYVPTSVPRVLGRLATRLRLWSQAIEHFETAIRQLSRGGALWELRKAYLDYAALRHTRRRRGDGSKAGALEIEAQRLGDQLGITHPLPGPSRSARSTTNRFGLSERELDVLRLVAAGLRNQEIAARLTLSPHTVERHLENIYGKMSVGGRTEAVLRAIQDELIGALTDLGRPTNLSSPAP